MLTVCHGHLEVHEEVVELGLAEAVAEVLAAGVEQDAHETYAE